MDSHLAVVVNEAQFAEFIHKRVHPRSRSTDHSGKRALTDICHERFRALPLGKICHQEKRPGETFFAGIKKLIDQVLFDAGISSQ